MRATFKVLVMAGTVLAAVVVPAAAADAAIVTSQASLVNGQLTIVGSGAVPNSNVTVDNGPPTGRADAKGDFTISASGFSEPSCVATLFDGSVSVEVTLSGCTPAISPPPTVPAPPTPVAPAPGASVTEPVPLSWQLPAKMPGVSPTFAPGSILDDVPEPTTEAHAPLFGFQTPLFIRVFGVAADGTLGLPSPTVAVKVTFHAPVPPPPSLLARRTAPR